MAWFAGAVLIVILFMSPLIGLFSMPFAPFWFGQRATIGGASVPIDIGSIPAGQLQVSDEQRYALAVAAGWSALEAITATAISIAENGSGNPAALSGLNRNGSRDLGLWQINSGWWSRFGGQAALIDPANNARAGYAIYQMQGWCAWSTYKASCGPGHTGSYAAFIDRAEHAANGAKHQ